MFSYEDAAAGQVVAPTVYRGPFQGPAVVSEADAATSTAALCPLICWFNRKLYQTYANDCTEDLTSARGMEQDLLVRPSTHERLARGAGNI